MPRFAGKEDCNACTIYTAFSQWGLLLEDCFARRFASPLCRNYLLRSPVRGAAEGSAFLGLWQDAHMGFFKRSRPDLAPPQSKWKRGLLGAFISLLLLVILAPILVARTPLRNWIAALALPQLQGDIRIGGASLWWWMPPVFTDLEVRDIAGRTLLSAPRIEGSKSLVALLCNPSDLGEFHLTQPAVHVVCSGDSTNLETALAYWLQSTDNPPDSGSPLEGIAVRAECTQASLHIQDEDTGRTWTLDPVDISAIVPRDRRTPLHFTLRAVVADGHQTGQLNAELTAHLVETKGDGPRLRAAGELHAEEV